MTETIAAIIPAAGYSSRMGRFKPLLPLGDAPLIRRLLTIFQQAGLTRIQVVTGHRAAELNGRLPFPADTIHNPDYPRGMFSSILRGIAGLAPEIEAAFILPVDIPLVRAATLRQLIRRFRRSRAGLVYPVFQGQRGHPPLISRDLLDEARAWSGEGGLRAFLEMHDTRAQECPLPDQGTVMDMDYPEDYQRILERYARLDLPSPEECTALQDCWGTSPQVRAHCRLVAGVAGRLGQELARRGRALDLELLFCGGLLHDLVRHLPDHARRGQEVLRDHGFSNVAGLVAAHVDGPFDLQGPITESELVYLADKLVQGDRRISLESRFLHKLEAFRNDPEASAAVKKRLERARKSRDRVESALGRALERLGPGVEGAGR